MLPAHFSENWGYLALSPMVAGNLFSLVFGRNLDAHDSTRHVVPNPPQVYSPQCLLGLRCYLDSIYLTMIATFLAVLLSIWAGYRDRQKIAVLRKSIPPSGSEVIWQDEAGQWWAEVDSKFHRLLILLDNTYDDDFLLVFSRGHYMCSCYSNCRFVHSPPSYTLFTFLNSTADAWIYCNLIS